MYAQLVKSEGRLKDEMTPEEIAFQDAHRPRREDRA